MIIKFGAKLPELAPGVSLKRIEESVRELWETLNVKKTIEEARRNAPVIGFIEGPPTMNGEPHLGHIRGRMLKDLWYRLETMRGSRVVFRAGWDTQGLPVELQAEKELGFTGSKAEVLQKVSMEKLVETCKRIVHKYNEVWRRADNLLGIGYVLDYDNAYWTYKDEYIEREWAYLKRAWDEGLLGEGYRVVAYCPSCQTSLSHSEVASSYEMLEDPSVYYKNKLLDEDAYLLVWTTMPFTVVTDELVGVNPDAYYVYVKVNGETWIVAEGRLKELMQELGIKKFKVERKVKGAELEGKRYKPPLLEEVPGQRKLFEEGLVHKVVAESFVDVSTGTGLVHLSPANGEEDFEVARKRGLPIFNPIDDQARFTSEAGKYAGKYVRDADSEIIEDLRRKNLLVKAGKIVHEYPVCWRSGHRLVFVARREYFYWVDKIVDKAVKAAEKVEYYYQQPRNRFIEIIKEARPWCISRERVWGTPLPIWVCSKCGHKFIVSSRKEILEKALELPDGPNFELHRPWIDKVVLKCPKCGSPAYREPFVLDTWHNSGAAPYASLSDAEFKQLVPVPFLTEGIDQTRGWAYSLLIEHVILTGKDEAPYKSFLFLGHVLDEKGEKMSKSKGNVVYALDLFEKDPVDLVRYYLVWKASPIDPINFSRKEMLGRPFQVINTLVNLFIFLKENSEYDGYEWNGYNIRRHAASSTVKAQDKWLISMLEKTVLTVLEAYEKKRFHEAARAIERFIIDTVSQKYIPLVRGELWEDDPRTLPRRLTIYDVLAHALLDIIKLLHPIAPYTTDYLYNIFYRKSGRPGLLVIESAPSAHRDLIDDKLEEVFRVFWDLVSIGNSARMKARVKRRWVLAEAHVYSSVDLPDEVRELLRQMLNVKRLKVHMDPHKLPAKLTLKPVTTSIGKKYKRKTPAILSRLQELDPWHVSSELADNGRLTLEVENERILIEREDVEFSLEAEEGYAGAYRDNMAVVLYVVRDEELQAEGIIRDIARRIQTLRKERGYKPTDILERARLAKLPREFREAIEKNEEKLLHLVRVRRIEVLEEPDKNGEWREYEIDGYKVLIDV